MKTTFFKPVFIIALALCLQSFTVKQQTAFENLKGKAEVLYNGIQDDMLVFKLKIANADKSRSFLTIKDAAGDEIYSSVYHDQNVTQTIKIPLSDQQLSFTINGKSLDYSKKFTVNTHYVKTIEVKESK